MTSFAKIAFIITLLFLGKNWVMAQDKSVYEDMSLDELLNVDVVVTASKKPEDLFEAPLSVTIIKKEEINRSGATNIPEALRLSPGLIVREITPGNYDVHIKGYDDITKNAYLTLPLNTMTLVMIDNRIVYSNFTGGTFWETFPIGLNDVEQIEVVRGPASALYGPNAVTGVINIITSRGNKKGLNVSLKGNAGTHLANDASANIGYNWNQKTHLFFTGNYSSRNRFNKDFFDSSTQEYGSIDEHQNLLLGAEKNTTTHETWTYSEYQQELGAWYNDDKSLRKMGGNLFFDHSFTEQSRIDVAMGMQKSQSLKTGFLNFATPLSEIESQSYYVDAKIKYKNISGQLNMNSGDYISNYKFNSYKFTDIDGNLDYIKQFKTISFRPGISFKYARYNSPITYDEPFSLTTLNYQFKDEPRAIYSYALSMLSEWKPTPKLRIIGAARSDKFNINKNYSFNYEFASTYRLNKNNMLRLVYSKANRSPFIFDTYLNSNFNINVNFKGSKYPIDVPVNLNIVAAKDLKFPKLINYEFGWRTKIGTKIALDLDASYSRGDNFIVSNVYREAHVLQLANPLDGQVDSVLAIDAATDLKFENYDVSAEQYSIGFTLNYNPNPKLQTKFFATYQYTNYFGKTEIEYKVTNLKTSAISENLERTMDVYSFTNPTQWSEKLTPSLYGGVYVNYQPASRWNISLDGYFYTMQRFVDYDYNNIMSDYSGVMNSYHMDIQENIILNLKTSYKINKHTSSFLSVKNILGKQRQFGYADQIGTLYLVGLQWNY